MDGLSWSRRGGEDIFVGVWGVGWMRAGGVRVSVRVRREWKSGGWL